MITDKTLERFAQWVKDSNKELTTDNMGQLAKEYLEGSVDFANRFARGTNDNEVLTNGIFNLMQ